TTPYVGVIDLGGSLDKLQTGSLNVALSDDVGVDWALYSATVATPLADAVGPSVFIDGGNLTVNTVISGIGVVKNGGVAGSQLTIAESGRLGIIDDFTQVAGSTLTIRLGGKNAGQYGAVLAGDKATVAGALKLELIGGFVPSAGNSFPIIVGTNGVTGTFAS